MEDLLSHHNNTITGLAQAPLPRSGFVQPPRYGGGGVVVPGRERDGGGCDGR